MCSPSVARHTPEEVKAAWAEFDLGSVPPPTVLPLPEAGPLRRLAPPRLAPAQPRCRAWTSCTPPLWLCPPKRGKPLVVSVHDAAPWLLPETFTLRGRWFHHAGMRAAARRADRMITGTEAAASELLAHTSLPAERLRVVPYGVDHPYQEPDPEEVWATLQRHGLDNTPYVLWVGSLEPRKGVGTLVEPRSSWPGGTAHRRSSWRGTPAGRTTTSSRPTTGLSSARPCVSWDGCLTPELQALYAGATVFAFPSLHEGFGLPVLEAMAAGVPVVASDIPAIREVAGDAAVLVPPGDVRRLGGGAFRVLGRARRSRLSWPGPGAGGRRCSHGPGWPRPLWAFTKNLSRRANLVRPIS